MLDEFKESQYIAYSLFKNAISSDRLSHAYLIDANHCESAFDFVLAFVKSILCNDHHTNFNLCDDCVLCKRIENNNYPELKIIEPESSVIKKEQLLDLQSEFSRSSIEGNYRIYIIKDCDRMNKQAANCLLKFLEEPVPGIIAILLTNNFSKNLSTIISRCQILRLNNIVTLKNNSTLENLALISCDNKNSVDLFLRDESKKNLIDSVLSFLDYFEENGLDIFVYIKKLWYNNFSTREDARYAFLLMVYFYYDVLNYKLGREYCFFCDKIENVKKCASINSVDSILHKINVMQYGYEMVFCNLNMNLLLDDIIIKLGDIK